MKLYIAGPMTGLPGFNYHAFHEASRQLRIAGFEVEDPADNERPTTDPWHLFMRDALTQMLTCDAVAVLPDAHKSRGAVIEISLAAKLGMTVAPLKDWLDGDVS